MTQIPDHLKRRRKPEKELCVISEEQQHPEEKLGGLARAIGLLFAVTSEGKIPRKEARGVSSFSLQCSCKCFPLSLCSFLQDFFFLAGFWRGSCAGYAFRILCVAFYCFREKFRNMTVVALEVGEHSFRIPSVFFLCFFEVGTPLWCATRQEAIGDNAQRLSGGTEHRRRR